MKIGWWMVVVQLAATACFPFERPAPPAGASWQRHLFETVPTLSLVNDQLQVAAQQSGDLDLGTGLLHAQDIDVLCARYDRAGEILEAWNHGGSSTELVNAAAVDKEGNVAVGVLYDGVGKLGGADLPMTPEGVLKSAAAIYRGDGVLLQQTAFDSTEGARIEAAAIGRDGHAGFAGFFTGTLKVNGAMYASAGGADGFYARLDDRGVGTVVTFGSTDDDELTAVLFDDAGTVTLVGAFHGVVQFGSFTLDAGPRSDVFVLRASLDGTPLWAIQGGGEDDVDLRTAALAGDGDVVLAVGYHRDFQLANGERVFAQGRTDMALMRVSPEGGVRWTRTFGGSGDERPRAITVGASGTIAVAGEYSEVGSFGGEVFTAAGIDGFVATYTGEGLPRWSRSLGGAGLDRGTGVAIDDAGVAYYAGTFQQTVDFGGGPLTAAGTSTHGVLLRLGP